MQIKHINDADAKGYMRSKAPELILCLGWSQLLDQEVLSIPKLGCVGFHPAALPFNRGRHPLIWALALGLEKTASTLFMMDATADTGKMVSQQYVDIEYTDDAARLYDKVMEKAVIQLENLLEDYEKDAVHFIESAEEGNVWRKRGKEAGKIDWRMSARSIYNLVRALTKPYVGAYFLYQGKEYKVWKIEEVDKEGFENIEPGKIIDVKSDHQFIIKAGDHLVKVLECDKIQLTIGEYL